MARCIGTLQHILECKYTNSSTKKAKTSTKIDSQKEELCSLLYACIKNPKRRIRKKLPHERDYFMLREIFGPDVLIGLV